MWEEVIDPRLVRRLRHRARRPGIVDPRQARAILARHLGMTGGLPLAERLARRAEAVAEAAVSPAPIVEAPPRPAAIGEGLVVQRKVDPAAPTPDVGHALGWVPGAGSAERAQGSGGLPLAGAALVGSTGSEAEALDSAGGSVASVLVAGTHGLVRGMERSAELPVVTARSVPEREPAVGAAGSPGLPVVPTTPGSAAGPERGIERLAAGPGAPAPPEVSVMPTPLAGGDRVPAPTRVATSVPVSAGDPAAAARGMAEQRVGPARSQDVAGSAAGPGDQVAGETAGRRRVGGSSLPLVQPTQQATSYAAAGPSSGPVVWSMLSPGGNGVGANGGGPELRLPVVRERLVPERQVVAAPLPLAGGGALAPLAAARPAAPAGPVSAASNQPAGVLGASALPGHTAPDFRRGDVASTATSERRNGQSLAPVDVDRIVDQVHRRFLRRLAIEGERRGAR